MKNNDDVIDGLAAAEASAWLVRLQRPATVADKAAFQEWLHASPAHARAFARVSDVWDLLPGAWASMRASAPIDRPRSRHRSPWRLAAACAALLLVLVGVGRMVLNGRPAVYQTAIGQQKTFVLDDGTHVTLNTDTRISVKYFKTERRVKLEHGEALFAVRHDQNRPFVLQAGNQQIVDLGTVFDVRHYAQGVVVTLLEGKVWVGAPAGGNGQRAQSTVLEPGQQWKIEADGVPSVDRADVRDATAWQHGRVYFDDTSLAAAVAELNRYGGTHLDVDDATVGSLRVSGVFSVHDPVQFASAVARLHGLRLGRKGRAVVIER